jgi:hypothetical protein
VRLFEENNSFAILAAAKARRRRYGGLYIKESQRRQRFLNVLSVRLRRLNLHCLDFILDLKLVLFHLFEIKEIVSSPIR